MASATPRRLGVMKPIAQVLLLLLAIHGCDCTKPLAPPVPSGALVAVGHVASLDGTWRMTTRVKGLVGFRTTAVEAVDVPGHAFPFNDKKAREVELVFERQFEVPQQLAHRRIVIELDSVDYWATVEVVDGRGQVHELGKHEGYLGRFTVSLGSLRSGTLRVRARDRWEAEATDETYPRTTLQGMDPTGWGINPMGILGSVRLRAVGSSHLLNGYAAQLEAGQLHIAAEIVAVQAKGGELRFDIVQRSRVVAGGALSVTTAVGRTITAQVVTLDAALDPTVAAEARLTISHDGSPSDHRTVPLVRRREPRRVQGVGSYYASRLGPAADGTIEGGVATMAKSYHGNSAEPYVALARSVRELNATWIRPAHHVPAAEFFAAMGEQGLLVYQDFPLHWNIDWTKLDEARILQQLDEFLWRMGNEPAVALVALHNEPEIKDPRRDEQERAQRLLIQMVARAKQLTPHLVVVGASGGASTAVFPPRQDLPVADDLLDKHGYFQSVWSAHQGIRQFPKLIAGLTDDGKRPTLWSEGGTPFWAHVIYLAHLSDELIEHPVVEKHIEPHLKIGDRKLTLRQFYAAVSCAFHDGVPLEKLAPCAKRKLASTDDATLIAHAKDHFFGGRDTLAKPADGNPKIWGRQIAAELFVAQIYEARIQRASGRGFVGFMPWEQGPIGVPPMASQAPSPAISYGRKLVADAYAPRAVYARIPADGSIAVFALNDGEPWSGALVLAGGAEPQQVELTIPSGGLSTHRFDLAQQPAPVVGEVRLEAAGAIVARYAVLLP